METKEVEIIEKITEVLNGSATQAISHYSDWFFANGISAVFFSVLIIIFSVIFFRKNIYKSYEFGWLTQIVLFLMIIISICVIAEKAPDIAAPQGKATHQLIKDIRG